MVAKGDDPASFGGQFGPIIIRGELSVLGRVWEGIFSASLLPNGRMVTGHVNANSLSQDQSFEEAIQRV